MGIDIFQSRRGYDEYCRWWSCDESEGIDDAELIMKRVQTGSFMAKEAAPERTRTSVTVDSFMHRQTTVTIKSPDDLAGMKANDLVEYLGERWIVTNVQKVKSRKQNARYAKDGYCSHFWYVDLRR